MCIRDRVCVVADSTADPALVAIDLMAQAEHDPLAACYLVTFDAAYADEVERMVERHLKSSTRAEITAASLVDQGLVVVCDSMPQALETVNVIAPEHLELDVYKRQGYGCGFPCRQCRLRRARCMSPSAYCGTEGVTQRRYG